MCVYLHIYPHIHIYIYKYIYIYIYIKTENSLKWSPNSKLDSWFQMMIANTRHAYTCLSPKLPPHRLYIYPCLWWGGKWS